MTTFLILPAYNEEKNICQLLTSVQHLPLVPILVDDGSIDATVANAQALHISHLIILKHEQNQGLGCAMNTGFRYVALHAQPDDIVVTMDADNTHPVSYIASLVGKINEGYDCVIASRFVGSVEEKGLSLWRKFLSRSARVVIRMVFGYPIADYTCGYRAYRVSLIQMMNKVFGESLIREKGFTCMAEIILKALSLNAKVTEIPFVLRYDLKKGKSKMRVIKTVAAYVRLIIRLKRRSK